MIGKRKFDVAVVGGGVAGCSAAISAVREGKRVVLLERSVKLGGLATNGLVNWWEPMCDGRGNQLIYGLSEEMLRRVVAYGENSIPPCWKSGSAEDRIAASGLPKNQSRYVSWFSPALCSLALLDWLVSEGVEVVFDALLTDVSVQEGRVTSLRFATQSGFERVYAKTYIDATGTAEIFFRGGFPTEEGLNGLSYVAHVADMGARTPASLRKWEYIGEEAPWHATDKRGFVAGTTREEVNRIVQSGQLGLYQKIKEGKLHREIVELPSMPQFRTVRRIVGDYTLTGEDANKPFPDSLCTGGDFEQKGVWYEIPYRCFYTRPAKNVFAAGRILSAVNEAWNATRVIPIAALTGEVAGSLACLALQEGAQASALPWEKITQKLNVRGILMHAPKY